MIKIKQNDLFFAKISSAISTASILDLPLIQLSLSALPSL